MKKWETGGQTGNPISRRGKASSGFSLVKNEERPGVGDKMKK